MGALSPAGGLSKTDIRKLLIRSTTIQSISIIVLGTAASAIVKYWIKHDKNASWHWLVPLAPVAGILVKKFVDWSYQTSQIKGVGVGTKIYSYVGDFAHGVARWQGLPEPDKVGFGPMADIVVTPLTPLDLQALKKGRYARKQKVIVRLGTPLLLTLSQRQIAILMSFHLAILDEPNPALTCRLLLRQAEFSAAKPGGLKARRGLALEAKTRQFNADINARGWARAVRAAGGDEQAARDAFAAAALVMRDFSGVSAKYKDLKIRNTPHPSAFYQGWAVTRRGARNLCPGEVPVLPELALITDKMIVSAWDTSQMNVWRQFVPSWKQLLTAGRGGGQEKERIVAPEKFDYSWLLDDPYGVQSAASPWRAVPLEQTRSRY